MNERGQLLLAASLLALSAFLLYRNRQQIVTGSDALLEYAGEAVEQGVEYMVKLTRGERNNNPGNIVKSDIFWRGEIAGDDKRFESFASPDEGIRALAVILQNYQKKYGLNTVRGIINRYAPPVENDTGAYINAVSGALGVSPDTPLNLADPGTLLPLVTAVIKHENGRVLYDQALIASAVGVA
jgi:hypothetical protein